ncbi:tRNA (N(6)-L-threonylcarbamoyladenosine(37)-C(2))-methylthiotransferase MtaB [bacterium]|nr:tRNA (N(6)-L-threonylcarbamoyladenosine(37)-C(2))-methylthiotransferase MtaB [bacterium]
MSEDLIIPDSENKKVNLNRFTSVVFGCKTNQSESDSIIRELESAGFKLVDFKENPDFAIINTCTVTSISDKKARQMIRRIKLQNPEAIIITTGCFVDFNRHFLKEIGVDYVFSNGQKGEISNLIKKIYGYNLANSDTQPNLKLTGKHTREFIKIQDGCEQKCSYCIVPYVRKKYKSEPPLKIVSEINQSTENGLEEIVLTGIHIGKYGADFKNKDVYAANDIKLPVLDLSALIELIINKTNVKRIRLSSIEINEITDKLLNLIKNNQMIARHLHIPLQSGSDRILEYMKRPYNACFFFEKINKIKTVIPDITLTSDIIVGFPGESDEDFNDTLNAAQKIHFSKIHVFKYSPRKYTPAALMSDQVREDIKNERSLKLRKLAAKLREEYIVSNNEKILRVAVERINHAGNLVSGMAENYIKVYFPLNTNAEVIKTGQLVYVKTESVYLEGLYGNLVDI